MIIPLLRNEVLNSLDSEFSSAPVSSLHVVSENENKYRTIFSTRVCVAMNEGERIKEILLVWTLSKVIPDCVSSSQSDPLRDGSVLLGFLCQSSLGSKGLVGWLDSMLMSEIHQAS